MSDLLFDVGGGRRTDHPEGRVTWPDSLLLQIPAERALLVIRDMMNGVIQAPNEDLQMSFAGEFASLEGLESDLEARLMEVAQVTSPTVTKQLLIETFEVLGIPYPDPVSLARLAALLALHTLIAWRRNR